jgi:hypothetical protein
LDRTWLAQVVRFDPPRGIEAPDDWEAVVRFLVHHGLAGIAAYNLEYRIHGAGAPQRVKDALLGFHQGTVNDNVYKLVTLQGALAGVEAPVVFLDGAAFADTLYPHIGFRAVPEFRFLVREEDRAEVERRLGERGFVPAPEGSAGPGEPGEPDPDGPAAVLWNTRFYLKLYTRLLPGGGEAGLFDRAIRAKAYGPGARRPAGEDALLLQVLSLARRGFAVPLVQLVDLRELIRADTGFREGPGAPLDPVVVRERAREVGAERALYAGLELVRWYFPEMAERVAPFVPALGAAQRALLDAAVIGPAKDPERERQVRGLDRLVRLLVG